MAVRWARGGERWAGGRPVGASAGRSLGRSRIASANQAPNRLASPPIRRPGSRSDAAIVRDRRASLAATENRTPRANRTRPGAWRRASGQCDQHDQPGGKSTVAPRSPSSARHGSSCCATIPGAAAKLSGELTAFDWEAGTIERFQYPAAMPSDLPHRGRGTERSLARCGQRLRSRRAACAASARQDEGLALSRAQVRGLS